MKILIISDTHGDFTNFRKVAERVAPLDLIIHLGDIEGDPYYLSDFAGCPAEVVAGNNDFFSSLEREKIIDIGQYRAFLTHGHRYYVNAGLENLKQHAVNLELDIAMFGHTHVPLLDMGRNVIVVNPGSLTYPRQRNRLPSYVIMEIDSHGEMHFTVNFVSETFFTW